MSAFQQRKDTFIIPPKATICKHGYLEKRGKLNKSFRKRWCVLYENNTISYFEHPENTNQTALGEISLYNVSQLDIHEDDNKENIFLLVTPKRKFSFKCYNKSEYKEWINILTIKLNPIVIKTGWATKRGEIHNTWKKRYFVLVKYKNDNKIYELRYYENDKLKKFKGVIECKLLTKIDTLLPNESAQKYGSKDKIYILELITSKRTYVLNFKDGNIRNKWKEELIKAFDAYNTNIKNKTNKKSDSKIITQRTLTDELQQIHEEKEEFSDN
eukprot:900092_1